MEATALLWLIYTEYIKAIRKIKNWKGIYGMKKLISLVLTLFCALGVIGCSNSTKNLQNKFPEYYNLDTFKGIEVYVWQTEKDEYMCGALSGTDRNKTFEEISKLASNGATIEEMQDILASYDIDKEEISIVPIRIYTDYFEIATEDLINVKEVFWKN